MEEQYITFETAKFAGSKGINWKKFSSSGIIINKQNIGSKDDKDYAWICKQSLLQKILREVYNIHINIKHRPHSQSFCFTITGKYQDVNDGELVNNIFSKYETYELALEAALQEALKLI